MQPLSTIGPVAPHPGTNAFDRVSQPRPMEVRDLQEISIAPQSEANASSFADIFTRLVGEVNEKQVAAGDAVNGLLAGNNVSLHQAMIAIEEASVSFQLMVEVRNKLVESYQELMRMQV